MNNTHPKEQAGGVGGRGHFWSEEHHTWLECFHHLQYETPYLKTNRVYIYTFSFLWFLGLLTFTSSSHDADEVFLGFQMFVKMSAACCSLSSRPINSPFFLFIFSFCLFSSSFSREITLYYNVFLPAWVVFYLTFMLLFVRVVFFSHPHV